MHTQNPLSMSNPNTITTPMIKPNPPPPLTTPSSSSFSLSTPRNIEYRKGNWTLQETLTLITAKRLDNARRSQSKQQQQLTQSPRSSSAELRWKWIENYCCAHGCLRSQNQCNDKWDNLLREYKKVSQFDGSNKPSYWEMEKQERKAFGLPSNMPFEIFDALRDARSSTSSSSNGSRRLMMMMMMNVTPVALVPKMVESMEEEVAVTTAPAEVVAPPPTQAQVNVSREKVPLAQPSVFEAEMSESSDSEAANTAEPDPKRQKVRDTGSGVVQGASILARTLLACEEKQDKRHRELMGLQERRLRLESDRTEMNRQQLTGLVSAFNSLSNAIHAFVSHHTNQSIGNAR